MSFKWHKNTRQYGSGEICYLGKWRVGSWYWDGTSQRDKNKYRPTCQLPVLPAKFNFENQENESMARSAVEDAVRAWIDKAGLDFRDAD